jgi:hypothetical protein
VRQSADRSGRGMNKEIEAAKMKSRCRRSEREKYEDVV